MLVTVQGNSIEDLVAEVASALRTTARPMILVIGYGAVPAADLEVVLNAARSLDQPKANDV